jgi:hypothetical protein
LPIERWRHQPVQIRSNGDAHGNLVGVSRYDNTGGGRYEKGDVYISRGQSQRMRRHGDERQSAPVGRRHGDRRRSDGKRRQTDGYVSNGQNSNRNNREIDVLRRPSRPVAKRSLSVIEKELAREEMDMIEEGRMKVESEHDVSVLASPPVYQTVTRKQGQDPSAYQNALIAHDDDKTRFTMEPEGTKIDDMPKPETTAIVLFTPPKEPEGGLAETPRRKPSRKYHHDKDMIYVCSPDDLPRDVRDKYGNHTEKPRDLRTPSRRKRRSYSDKLKESFRLMRKEGQSNDGFVGNDDLHAALGSEGDSESRKKRMKIKKKKETRKSNHRSLSHQRHESNGDDGLWINIVNGSTPSILTTPPEIDLQAHTPSRFPEERPPRKRLSQNRLFSSFRRSDENDLEFSDDESVQHC